jgi:hypothetical protein
MPDALAGSVIITGAASGMYPSEEAVQCTANFASQESVKVLQSLLHRRVVESYFSVTSTKPVFKPHAI